MNYETLTDAAFLRTIADERERAMKYMSATDRPRFETCIARLREIASGMEETHGRS